jgi:hypothetical protein
MEALRATQLACTKWLTVILSGSEELVLRLDEGNCSAAFRVESL